MTDLETTEAFVSRHGKGYRDLATEVLKACKAVQKSTSGMIYRAYSRGEKQNGEELKDASKILEKIEPPVTEQKLIELNDIIGVTIVIYYPDDAPTIFKKVQQALRNHSIKVATGPRTHESGYYLRHRQGI